MTREAFDKVVVIQHKQDGDMHMYKATLGVTAVEYVSEFSIPEKFDKQIKEHLLNTLWHHIFEDRRHLASEKMYEFLKYHHPIVEHDKAEKARNELMALLAWK